MIILLSGKKKHGKDSAAGFLSEYFKGDQYSVNTFSFALSLKKAAAEIFQVPLYYFTSQEYKEQVLPDWNITPREILQKLGSEVGRNINKDVWVLNVIKKIEEFESNVTCGYDEHITPVSIVTDCRFSNEIELIRNRFKDIEKVVAIRIIRTNFKDTSEYSNHISETALDEYKDFDYYIQASNLTDLQQECYKVATIAVSRI